jgi:hypothetical protein
MKEEEMRTKKGSRRKSIENGRKKVEIIPLSPQCNEGRRDENQKKVRDASPSKTDERKLR